MTLGPTATAESPSAPAVTYPTRRDEAWRYAPIRDLESLVFGPSPDRAPDLPTGIEARIPAIDGPRLVVVDGRVDELRSDLAALPPGLELLPLANALDQRPDEMAAHFAIDTGGSADAFVAINQVYGRDGAFVRVGEGHRLDRPIHLVDVSTAEPGDTATSTSAVIHLAPDSSATLVETHIGAGTSAGGSNLRSTVVLDAGASLTHIVLQGVPADQVQLTRIEVHQAEGSEFRARSFNFGAHYGRIDYQVTLAGEQAVADLAGLYAGAGDQTLDQQITVVHEAGDCTSRQAFRGVLDDRSTGVFNGGIVVCPGADGTASEQANDNLLLSTRAEANTQPRLEILADDVVCKHGATVGQLDDDALYYLRSRGITADQARQLLIAGFIEQTVEEVEIEAVRTWITERLGHDDA